MKPVRKEATGGIPWVAILDADGAVLATSNKPERENIGYTSSTQPDGIQHFLKMLKSTKQRMSDDDLATRKKVLEKE